MVEVRPIDLVLHERPASVLKTRQRDRLGGVRRSLCTGLNKKGGGFLWSCGLWRNCITIASNQSSSLFRYLLSFFQMELRHLQALTAIDDHGTFSAAAAHLNTVQSNVSAHVARLERELGAPMIDRATGVLTEEGRAVVARTRRILAELDALVADVAACRDEVTGTVRIGIIGTTARWLVPELMDAARIHHPGLQLIAVEGTTSGLEPRLASGQLDLAILHLPVTGKDLVTRQLFAEDLMLVVPEGHALAEPAAPLMLEDLAEVKLLLPVQGPAFRDELDAVARRRGITLHPAAEFDGLRLIASLAFGGYGPAILPATAIPRYLSNQFRPVPVEGLPRRRVGIVQRSRGMPSAPSRALVDLLIQVLSESEDQPDGLHLAW